jgi:hypothetical protein
VVDPDALTDALERPPFNPLANANQFALGGAVSAGALTLLSFLISGGCFLGSFRLGF